ncbi:hypothetical protein ACO22_06959, partial [Paracoccidioides brasiliensis]
MQGRAGYAVHAAEGFKCTPVADGEAREGTKVVAIKLMEQATSGRTDSSNEALEGFVDQAIGVLNCGWFFWREPSAEGSGGRNKGFKQEARNLQGMQSNAALLEKRI